MSLKTLSASSVLDGSTVADLFSSFRRRVDEQKDVAERVVEAFDTGDSDMFYELVNPRIGDGAFDQALFEGHSSGQIEDSLFHALTYSLMESASAAGIADGEDMVVVTEIFALPLTGTIEDILTTSGDVEIARSIARAFTSTGYVAEGTRVLLSPTTIDPLAVASIRPAVARHVAHEFQDAFAADYDAAAAERLFEAVQTPFESLSGREDNHLDERGTVTRFMIGATQRVLSTTRATNADAFLFNMLDEAVPEEMVERSENFLSAVCHVPGVEAAPYYPLPLARATSFAAVAALGAALQEEAELIGLQRPDRAMDEIVLTRTDGKVFAEGIVGSTLVGPAAVPEALVLRDDTWFVNRLACFADEFSERKEMLISGMRMN